MIFHMNAILKDLFGVFKSIIVVKHEKLNYTKFMYCFSFFCTGNVITSSE